MTRSTLLLMLLSLTYGGHCSDIVTAPGHEAYGASFWRADVVVVVTWHNASIAWMADLPHHAVKAVIYVKGDLRRCSQVPKELKSVVLTCTELPNYQGREAHTMALFVSKHYDHLPRITYFAQDDCVPAMVLNGNSTLDTRASHCQVLKLAILGSDPHKLAELVAKIEADPFTRETCLCSYVVELRYRPCVGIERFAPFNGQGSCYGDRYFPISWFQSSMLGLKAADHTGVRWAGGAHFAVPAWAIRTRGVEVYRLALALLDGQGGRDDIRTATLWHSSREIEREWSAFSWAHTFERLWFSVMDPKYEAHLLEDVVREEERERQVAEARQREQQRLAAAAAASGGTAQRRSSRRRGLRSGGAVGYRPLTGAYGDGGGEAAVGNGGREAAAWEAGTAGQTGVVGA